MATSDSADPVKVGEEFTYRTVVSNVGTLTANELGVAVHVRHSDVRGTAVFSSVTTNQGSCTQDYGLPVGVPFHYGVSDLSLLFTELYSMPRCTIGTLAPGSAATIDVVVRSTYPSTVTDPSRHYPRLTARSYFTLDGRQGSDGNYVNDGDTEGTTVLEIRSSTAGSARAHAWGLG